MGDHVTGNHTHSISMHTHTHTHTPSLHLYHVFPSLTDGELTAYRRPLVKNKHLAIVAHGLDLRRYMLVASNVGLSSESVYNHTIANCLEALLGAVFLDGGLPAAQRLLTQVLFPEEVSVCVHVCGCACECVCMCVGVWVC